MSLTINLKPYTLADVSKHHTEKDLWVVIHGKVYDLTEFHHPGTRKVIVKIAGTDATDAYEKNHFANAEHMAKFQKFCIGIARDSSEYNFDACLRPKEPVHAVFVKYLERIHSKEQLDCIAAIEKYKASPSKEIAESILHMYIENQAQTQVNLDDGARSDYVKKIESSDSFLVDFFNPLHDTLLLQLKNGVYDSFISSLEFKVWISSRYQSELMDTMAVFLNDFGKEEVIRQSCLDCYF